MKKKVFVTVIIVLVLCFSMTACSSGTAPNDETKGRDVLEKAGYDVELMSKSEIYYACGEVNIHADGGLIAVDAVEKKFVFALWFTDKEAARDFLGLYRITGENFNLFSNSSTEEYTCDIIKNVFYIGNEKGIEDLFGIKQKE